uniref:CBS domain-containing protein n=1 Tax=Vitis vinifera TaxID=29760 RepID=A5BR80_VITVI|nr:hypothetical protein VITISV_004872 [Vitis vinifera]
MESITFSDLHVIAGPSVTPHGARGGSPSLSRTFFSPSRFRSPVPLVALRRRPAHAAITTNSVPVVAGPSLPYGRFDRDRGDGTWAMAGCCDNVRPDVYVYKCRLPFLEAVRIEEARHVYPDGGDPDDNACHHRNGTYRVGDFMTKKEHLHVVKPTTPVDEALEALVEKKITGFPVIDEDWKLVGLVSDYDLLALDSISGGAQIDTTLFPDVDSSWKAFNQIQKLLAKTKGKVVGDVMTPAPVVVHETTNLEDAARLLLETKYRRLPVVDGDGKLVGIVTRGSVVRAALKIKGTREKLP